MPFDLTSSGLVFLVSPNYHRFSIVGLNSFCSYNNTYCRLTASLVTYIHVELLILNYIYGVTLVWIGRRSRSFSLEGVTGTE